MKNAKLSERQIAFENSDAAGKTIQFKILAEINIFSFRNLLAKRIIWLSNSPKCEMIREQRLAVSYMEPDFLNHFLVGIKMNSSDYVMRKYFCEVAAPFVSN